MSEPARKRATYDDLYTLPPNMTGQIIEGELYAFPRPHSKHAKAASALNGELVPPFSFGRGGGPGGWVILVEPEIMLGDNLLVPDLAGWKIERLPGPPKENFITVTPDWVCEILSPGTARLDRIRKMPVYARHEVKHLWIIDPILKTLEVYGLKEGSWVVMGTYGEDDQVRAEPFEAVEINLADLWWGD